MAVKASAQITISKVIDVYAVYRYYKLQSSTLAKPAKPTANPPSGWSDTEPAYVSGSTNTLYFVDCNVYSDKSFSFSEVSKSSSYEAAKDAWNKANNAQNSVDNLQIGGRNLLIGSKTLTGDFSKYYDDRVSSVYGDFKASKSSSAWAGPSFDLSTIIKRNNLKIGDILTMSIMVMVDFTPDRPCSFTVYRNVQGNTVLKAFTMEKDRWYKLSATFVLDEYSMTAMRTGLETNYYKTVNPTTDNLYDFEDGYMYFAAPKLELGNKATDWSPAPEDAIASVDVEYYLSTSATSLSGGSWSTTAPTWVNGKYMWSRTVTVDGAGNKTYSPSQNGVCIAGAKGDTGNTGAAGKGVKSIVEQYYKSTSATSLSGGSWSATYPGWENGKYIWTRSVITYTDDTTTTTTAVCVTGAKGEKGDKGNTGAAGKDAAIISSTEPTDKTYLWCDTSASPPLLKRWNGEEWIIVNDNAEQITQIYKEITNSITQASENILMQVGEKTYSKEAVDRLLNDTNTSLEQTKDSFNFEFNRFQTALDNLSNSSDSKFEDISKYIRFVDGEIHIGIVGNPIMLRQRNDRISFLENNVEVAYISNRTLYFTHAEVLKDLKIGRFSWVAMDSGYLALKLVE